MLLVNIGCGEVFHEDWLNLDIKPLSPLVTRSDLRKGLPLLDGSADACYSSHVLEHLAYEDSSAFVIEQTRVLRPGGTLRIAVPDLEVICRSYVTHLDGLLGGDRSHQFAYDYTLLELFDQSVREVLGGRLARVWAMANESELDYIRTRQGPAAAASGEETPRARDLRIGLRQRAAEAAALRVRRARIAVAEALVHATLGRAGRDALRCGLFRASGEIHRWMYDRYSLGRLLDAAGLIDIAQCVAGESRIPDFHRYALEVVDGTRVPRKPDSLYMEATKAG